MALIATRNHFNADSDANIFETQVGQNGLSAIAGKPATEVSVKEAYSSVFSRSINLETRLIEFFVFVNV